MQKKGIKLELALIDEVKKVLSTSMSFNGKLKVDENTVIKLQEELNSVHENVNGVIDFFDKSMRILSQFEAAMKELGIEAKTNQAYMQSYTSVNDNLKLATKLQSAIKGLK
jgi:ornithine carbamoyltransferase